MKNYLLLIVLLFALSGCGKDGGISIKALSDLVDGVETISGDVVDASTAKELAITMALINRDKQRAKMYKTVGFTMDWRVVENNTTIIIPGSILKGGLDIPITVTSNQYLPITTYKPEPRFQFALPTKPSEHPVWRTAEKLAYYGLIGFGIHEVMGAWKASTGGTTTTYNGPVKGSFNTAGNDQTITVLRDYAPITGGTP